MKAFEHQILGQTARRRKKEQNKSVRAAHWRTEACKLFRSSFLLFKFSSTINYVNAWSASLWRNACYVTV